MRLFIICFACLISASVSMAQTTNVFPPNGNAGIGTNSPSIKLEVLGGIKADSIVFPDGSIQYTSPGNSFQSISIGDSTLVGTQNGFIRDDGDLRLQTSDTLIQVQQDRTTGDTISIDTIIFTTSFNTIINGDNTGRVGIGTLSPSEKLTVAGTVESTNGGFKFPDGTVQTSAASGGTSVFDSLTVIHKLRVGGSVEVGKIVSSDTSSLGRIQFGDSSLYLSTNNHRIYTQGSTLGAPAPGMTIGNPRFPVTGNNVVDFFCFAASALDQRALAPNSMALGYNLKVTSSADYAMVIGSGLTSGTPLSCGGNNGTLTNDISNSLMIGFNSGESTLFVEGAQGIDPIGKVGIGTIDPNVNARLHVVGKTAFAADNVSLSMGILTATGVQIHQPTNAPPPGKGNAVALLIGDTTARSMFFAPYLRKGAYNPISQEGDIGIIFRRGIDNRTAGFVIAEQGSSYGIRITPDGNVGIGTPLSSTSTPPTPNTNNYKLAVNGRIGAKDVWVEETSDAWPDYVFEPDYKLRSIPELGRFIKKNHFLPGFKSASEIKDQRAISIAETLHDQQLILEEYALYLVSLNERLEKLEKENIKKDELIAELQRGE